jgi:hypothetical protein
LLKLFPVCVCVWGWPFEGRKLRKKSVRKREKSMRKSEKSCESAPNLTLYLMETIF